MIKDKILFIPYTFSNGGGAEKVLFQLINELKKNYDISILEKYHSVHPYNSTDDIDVLPPISYSNELLINTSLFLKCLNLFWCKISGLLIFLFPRYFYNKYVIKRDYDYEISFNYLYVSYLLGHSVNRKSKKIMWIHTDVYDLKFWECNYFPSYIKNWFYFNMQKRAFANADKIVAISNYTFKSIIELFPDVKEKVVLVYNGYDFSEFSKMASAYSFERKKHKIRCVTAGRLDERKNQCLIISALSILKDEGYDFEMLILGEGDKKKELQSLVKSKSLEDNVVFCGFNANPYPIIQSADVFLLSSLAEGFPTVIVESLYLGIPVVTTPVGGVEELIQSGVNGEISDYSAIGFSNSIKMVLNSVFDHLTISNSVTHLSVNHWAKNIEDKVFELTIANN